MLPETIPSRLLEFYEDDILAPERCGFVGLEDEILECKNICHEPANGFDFSGEDLLRYEDQVKASWHTHTGTNCNLTSDDRASFLNYPSLSHYIVGSDGVACYVVEGGQVIRAATYPSSRVLEVHPPGGA